MDPKTSSWHQHDMMWERASKGKPIQNLDDIQSKLINRNKKGRK
jgi:hypothetical protein